LPLRGAPSKSACGQVFSDFNITSRCSSRMITSDSLQTATVGSPRRLDVAPERYASSIPRPITLTRLSGQSARDVAHRTRRDDRRRSYRNQRTNSLAKNVPDIGSVLFVPPQRPLVTTKSLFTSCTTIRFNPSFFARLAWNARHRQRCTAQSTVKAPPAANKHVDLDSPFARDRAEFADGRAPNGDADVAAGRLQWRPSGNRAKGGSVR
jgi:hypothetical protein